MRAIEHILALTHGQGPDLGNLTVWLRCDRKMETSNSVHTFDELAKLQLEIYAKELKELYREQRLLRAKLAEYGHATDFSQIPAAEHPPRTAAVREFGTPAEDLYEGTVRLDVQAEGGIGLMVRFVRQLRAKPEVRLRRMENNGDGSVTLMLSLREPISLRLILSEMNGVSEVGQLLGDRLASESDRPPLTLRLIAG